MELISPPDRATSSRVLWVFNAVSTERPWLQRVAPSFQVVSFSAEDPHFEKKGQEAPLPEAIVVEADCLQTWETLSERARLIKKMRGAEKALMFLAANTPDLQLCAGAFQSGALDVLTPELTPQELVLRILSRLAAPDGTQRKPVIHLGSLCLDPNTLGAQVGSTEVPLTPLEFDLIVLLAQNPNQIFSRDEILTRIWREIAVSRRTVDAHVSCVRRKLPAFEYELTTVYGAGYLMKRVKPERESAFRASSAPILDKALPQ